MADEEAQLPHPGLAEAERRVRSAISDARADGNSSMLALRHAELGMILVAQGRLPEGIAEYRISVGFIDLLRTDGSHTEQRLTRITSMSAPPPDVGDYDLDRLDAEVRVALVEALTAAGDLGAAHAELQRAAPLTKGFFRRRLRKRLDRAAAIIAAAPASQGQTDLRQVQRHLARSEDPAQQRGLRLRLANGYLDAHDYVAAIRESLLLIKSADDAGDATVRAGARQVLGLALEGQGRGAEALPILSDAFADLRTQGDAKAMVGMGEALAKRLLDAGDATGAAAVLRDAAQAAGSCGDTDAQLSIATMLGVVLDSGGDRRGAVDALNDAAAQAERAGAALARADALHSAAVALGRSSLPDDLVEALSVLDEAKRIYLDHDMADRAAGCDHEAAALLGRHGSYDAAATRYRNALAAYEALPVDARDTGSWPDEMADCRSNLAWLDGGRTGPADRLFASGGHTMSHLGPGH